MKLPGLPYGSKYRTATQTAFGGLEHNPGGTDGSLYAMENLSARAYPLLSPRARRGLEQTLEAPYGLTAGSLPCWVDGTGFYVNGVQKGTVTAGEKHFAVMGNDILIFPDKLRYSAQSDTLQSLEAGWEGASLNLTNGQLFEEEAYANTLYAAGVDWAALFSPGDGVTITGCTVHPENNRTVVVREISGSYLRFYEYSFVLDAEYAYSAPAAGLSAGEYCFVVEEVSRSFTLPGALSEGDSLVWDGVTLTMTASGAQQTLAVSLGSAQSTVQLHQRDTAAYTETGTLSIRRSVPALEHLCVNENRLWGSVGGTIYASKLGDPCNFSVFDGLSTDSWVSDTADAGDFTACVSYLGYPVFFKEDCVYKVYGDRPSNFQWTPSARMGVLAGCEKSLAVAGETLFYLSRAGIAAYTGGIPTLISAPLGRNTRFQGAVAGSDGLRYVVSLYDGTDWALYVYDTRVKLWHREDGVQALDLAFWGGGLHLLASDGKLWRLDGEAGTLEEPVAWEAVFADQTEGSPNQKGLLRLQLRVELEAGSTLTAAIRYDSAETYQTIATLTAQRKRSAVLPLAVRRCDHWSLKLSGTGESRIYSLAVTRYRGSEQNGTGGEV